MAATTPTCRSMKLTYGYPSSSQNPGSHAYLVSVSSPPHLDRVSFRLTPPRVPPPLGTNIRAPYRQDDQLVPRSDRRARPCRGIRLCSYCSPSPGPVHIAFHL